MANKKPTEAQADSIEVPGTETNILDQAKALIPAQPSDEELEAMLDAREVQMPIVAGAPDGHLPHASDINPREIKTMTLTQEGWVLPEAAEARAKQ